MISQVASHDEGERVFHGLLRAGSFALICLLQPADAMAAPNCKSPPPDPGAGDSQYRSRGDRCEGIFQRQVAASLAPQSLTIGKVEVPKTGTNISVSWSATQNQGSLELRARSLSCDPPYQMSATVSASKGAFSWPSTIPSSKGVQTLGILNKGDGGVVIPTRSTTPSAGADYEIAFCSSSALTNATLKVHDQGGKEVHKKALRTKAAGPVFEAVPSATFKSGEQYKVSLTSGSLSAGFQFRAP
jgi:hypothetical protein